MQKQTIDNNMPLQNLKSTKVLEADAGGQKKHAYLIFTVVSVALLMISVDVTIVAVALPTLITDLNTNLALVSWTLVGYNFANAVVMPIVGKLSDEWGSKRIFLVATVVFTVSSIAAGLAPNILWLIVFRVIQGIGGGAFLPAATGIVSDVFAERRASAIGLFTSFFGIGAVLGPNIGGFIIDNFSWRWIFFVNVPIGIALIVLGTKILPQSRARTKVAQRRLDAVGMGLFTVSILSILYAVTDWANNPSSFGLGTLALIALGAALFAVFLRYESKIAQPMIESKLLRWRPYLAVNIYNFIFGAVIFGLFSFVPYYATVGYGMTAGQSGLILTPRSVAMILLSTVTSLFILRFRYRMPMIIGLILIALSSFLLSRGYHDASFLGMGFHNLLLLSLLVVIAGIGAGIANPAANNAALDIIPGKVAAVAGMRGMFRIVGGVLGTSVITLILSKYGDQAIGMQEVFLGLAIILLLLIPVVFLIPDSAKQAKKHIETNGGIEIP